MIRRAEHGEGAASLSSSAITATFSLTLWAWSNQAALQSDGVVVIEELTAPVFLACPLFHLFILWLYIPSSVCSESVLRTYCFEHGASTRDVRMATVYTLLMPTI